MTNLQYGNMSQSSKKFYQEQKSKIEFVMTNEKEAIIDVNVKNEGKNIMARTEKMKFTSITYLKAYQGETESNQQSDMRDEPAILNSLIKCCGMHKKKEQK